jgi:hypothetical protein
VRSTSNLRRVLMSLRDSRLLIAPAARSRSQALRSSEGTADILSLHVLKVWLGGPEHSSIGVWTKEMSRFMFTIASRTNLKTITENDLRDQVFDGISTLSLAAAALTASELEPYVPSWVKTHRDYTELANQFANGVHSLPAYLANVCQHTKVILDQRENAMQYLNSSLSSTALLHILK